MQQNFAAHRKFRLERRKTLRQKRAVFSEEVIAMRLAVGLFALAVVGLNAAPAAAQSKGGACFYTAPNYQGMQSCIGPTERFNNVGPFNDKFNSVQIPPGQRVQICEDDDFEGQCLTLEHSIPNLAILGFANGISSISSAFGAAPPPRAAMPPPPPPPQYGARPLPPMPPSNQQQQRGGDRRAEMFQLRQGCEDGDRRSCVRLGIIIGENRERRSQWKRENPDLFFWEE